MGAKRWRKKRVGLRGAGEGSKASEVKETKCACTRGEREVEVRNRSEREGESRT